jgi:phosphoribosylanthranilate isomerase
MVRVKVCGVTTLEDAKACVEAGVDAIGLNFWSGSVRRCELTTAREIVRELAGRALFVGVFVDADESEIVRTLESTGVACVQLHGAEPPELVARFLPHAYKAVRVRGSAAVEEVRRYPGEYVLLDAYVKGLPGGTGETFDWAIAREVASERKLTLAGGLTPENVADAVREVQPFCVDTASGVESAPGIKDHVRVRAFVERARGA